jgi:hypothetical protein
VTVEIRKLSFIKSDDVASHRNRHDRADRHLDMHPDRAVGYAEPLSVRAASRKSESGFRCRREDLNSIPRCGQAVQLFNNGSPSAPAGSAVATQQFSLGVAGVMSVVSERCKV